MHLPINLFLLPLIFAVVIGAEKSNFQTWNFQDDSNEPATKQVDDLQAVASEAVEEKRTGQQQETEDVASATAIEDIVTDILTSTRQGRNLDGFDEVYTDPSLQEAIQKGDDTEARNIIKDKLCNLGLMECTGRRPHIAPEDLIYAQPVAINPVGKPIPTIPLKAPRGHYGPPKPLPYPIPPTKPHRPLNSYGASSSYYGGSASSSYFNGPPIRKGYSPSKPFYGNKPFLNQPPLPPPVLSETPYQYESIDSGSYHLQDSLNKDKKLEVVVAQQGNKHDVQQHVHHHFHHTDNEGGVGKVTATKPIHAVIDGSYVEESPFKPSNTLSIGSNYGGQLTAQYGTSSTQFGSVGGTNSGLGSFATKPIHENQGPQTFGQSSLYDGSSSSSLYGGSSSLYGGSSSSSLYGRPTSSSLYDGSTASSSYGGPTSSSLYGGNSFGASVGSYGSSNFYKKELNVNGNGIYSNHLQGSDSSRIENYDCVCVPYDQCPSHEVIGRKDDLYLPLDPRNLKSDIEATESNDEEEEERVITDGNGTETVVRVAKGAALNVTEAVQETKRTKREAPVEADKLGEKSNGEARQAFYRPPQGRPKPCGPRHVCCRRPFAPQVPPTNVPNGNGQCGVRHSQGINGRIKNPVYVDGDSEFGEYPWQVAILKKDPKESVYVCGGTLIDAVHIVTAAHCIKTYTPYDLRVRLGEWDVNHDVEFFPYIERDIVSVNVHPEFYAGTLYNDIAIIRLDRPVDFGKNPHISPACLPSPHEQFAGTRCWTTGWGKDAFGEFGKYQNILKEVDVPIVGHQLCEQQLRQTRLGYDFQLHPGFVCAGGEEGKDACKGDGGGPMVCERNGLWKVVGVVSWGIGCGHQGVPGVYVKVAHYLDWIRQVTQRF